MSNFRMQANPYNGMPEAYSGVELAPGWDPEPGWSQPSGFPVRVTPKAAEVLRSISKGTGHIAFTWGGVSLHEVAGPKYQDGKYRLYYSHNKGYSDVLRFGNLNVPGSIPQTNMGDGNQPAEDGMAAPLARSMGGAFFDAAISPGGSISLNYSAQAAVRVDLGQVRDQFAKSFGNMLRPFFGDRPTPTLSKPSAGPVSSKWTLYHRDDSLAPDSGPGPVELAPPDQPVTPPGGGADERYLPLIDSTLNKMSGQLGKILDVLKDLKEPREVWNGDDPWYKWFGLVKNGLELAEKLMGISGKASSLAADLATATGSLAGLNSMIDKYKDLIDSLTDSAADDLADDRFDKMADIFMYRGKSITQYVAAIADALKPQEEGQDESSSLDLEELAELLDKYFLEPVQDGEIPGNLFQALSTMPNIQIVAKNTDFLYS